MIIFSNSAYAVVGGHDSYNTKICFNRSTGVYGGAYSGTSGSCPSGFGTDSVKLINGIYAYCSEWKLRVCSQNYNVDSGWSTSSKNAITAGIMIDLMEKEYGDAPQRYEMVAAIMNTFSYWRVNSSTSYDFYSTNSSIKKIYDQATAYEKELQLGTSLPSLSLSISSKVMNLISSSSQTYISEQITLSGLVDTYGGPTTAYGKAGVSYTITPSTSNGTIQICTNANGTGCSSSVNLTGKTGTYSFYVKTVGASASDTIKINVQGSNSSTYPTIVRYTNANCGNSSQHLVSKDNVTISRSVSQSLQLAVPDLVNHRIIGYKVNEFGESLDGAALELYRDDPSVANNLLAQNQVGKSEVSYTTEDVETSADDFFNHDYYLVERQAPNGYVFTSEFNHFYKKETGSKNETYCYYNSGSDSGESQQVDAERCNFEAYQYKCQNTDGDIVDLSDNQNCTFVIPNPDAGTGDDGNTDTGDTGEVDSGNTDTSDTGEEDIPAEITVTYDTVCYNVNTNQVVADATYCSDKDQYISVSKSNGNLIVTQVNKRNTVRISKKAVTGDDELSGAKLKICSSDSYNTKKENCDPASTIDQVTMSWTSGDQPYEFVGIPKGTYYIVEEVPPKGYVKATTAMAFSIDEKGDVKTSDGVITNEDFVKRNASVVVRNQLSSITISKQDVATGKELPGATISICRTYVDENNETQLIMDQYENECIAAVLQDGSEATWVSTDTPKEIIGLSAGTYYLVEKIAPTDYSTAESILFTLNSDGSLVDKDGNSLQDHKLVMKDKSIHDVKTGQFPMYVVGIILVVVLGLGFGSYSYLKSKSVDSLSIKKVRSRKIHKK